MRYFIVNYLRVMVRKGQKMQEQMDEVVSVRRNLRLKDQQTAAVILDFRKQQVVQASMDGVTVPRDWWRIRDFYHQHYARIIEDLEAANGLKIVDTSQSTPDKDPVSVQ
jgi:hypothetical protein